MCNILKKILLKAIVLVFITILPIALYVYIQDDVQIAWNINDVTDMNKYIMTVEIDSEDKEIYIKEKVEFINNTNKELDKIYFYLVSQSLSLDEVCADLKNEISNQDNEEIIFDVESITMKGKSLNYNIIGKTQNIVMVNLGTKIQEGQKTDIEINGVLDFPHITDKTEDGRNTYDIINWYPVIAEYDEGWMLNVDESYIEKMYSDEGEYYVEIIISDEADVTASGELIDKRKKGGKLYLKYKSDKFDYFTFTTD